MSDNGRINLKLPGLGVPAPRFIARTDVNERFTFDTMAGRYVVLAFVGSAGSPHGEAAKKALAANRDLFDDGKASFFWVTCDAADKSEKRLADSLPGVRVFWDFDQAVSKAYGVAEIGGDAGRFAPFFMLVDPQMRMLALAPMAEAESFFAGVRGLPPVSLHGGVSVPAPILVLPRVLEPDLCKELISLYQNGEAVDSGFMRQVGGKTVLMKDYAHKRRQDVSITDQALIDGLRGRLRARLVPEIERAFQFKATRIERYIVACYNGEDAAHFKPHRDNTTMGTAHRRFAVTINLNAEDYEGGDLVFPEFGPTTYRAPTGGAVVFSCSLLHEVKPMTKGLRYAFLPFLYDEAAAKVREENLHALDDSLKPQNPAPAA